MHIQSQILNKILVHARTHVALGGRFKAVFDLDSTLFDVNPRVRKILNDFATLDSVRLKFASAAQVLSNPKLELKETYKLKDQIIHIGLTNEAPEFYATLLEFWKQHFFGNDYLKYDEPYEGAVEYVQEMHALGAYIYYLTGRDIPRMGAGTEAQIKQWNLPLGERGELVMKPQKDLDDAEFKRDFLMDLPREQVEVWFFENEPVNVDLVLREVNHVNVVYFDSVHMEKAEPPGLHVPRIKDFKK